MPTLFVNDLTNIDCSILDPSRGLIGASWAVDIELSGELDEQSMVFDFSKVKKTIKSIIDRDVDHKLLVPADYQGLTMTQSDTLHIKFTDQQDNHIEHQSPSQAVCLIPCQRVGRKDIIVYLKNQIMPALPDNVEQLHIELREESVSGNYFRYSHGLKKHDGNCQRIAHGHRSQIQIWQDGQRDDALEQELAARWQDIYLGTEEDISQQTDKRIQFTYTTEQGRFMLELPINRVHVMPNDSTVECIAEHVLALLSDAPNTAIRVKAFEGIGKGAIANSSPIS